MKPRAREGGQRGFTLRVGRNGFRNRQGAESPFFPPLDLRLEQIERSRQRKHQDHRHHEQAGIEMPAPDRAVEGAWEKSVESGSASFDQPLSLSACVALNR
jgi:hypothetical protein